MAVQMFSDCSDSMTSSNSGFDKTSKFVFQIENFEFQLYVPSLSFIFLLPIFDSSNCCAYMSSDCSDSLIRAVYKFQCVWNSRSTYPANVWMATADIDQQMVEIP